MTQWPSDQAILEVRLLIGTFPHTPIVLKPGAVCELLITGSYSSGTS